MRHDDMSRYWFDAAIFLLFFALLSSFHAAAVLHSFYFDADYLMPLICFWLLLFIDAVIIIIIIFRDIDAWCFTSPLMFDIAARHCHSMLSMLFMIILCDKMVITFIFITPFFTDAGCFLIRRWWCRFRLMSRLMLMRAAYFALLSACLRLRCYHARFAIISRYWWRCAIALMPFDYFDMLIWRWMPAWWAMLAAPRWWCLTMPAPIIDAVSIWYDDDLRWLMPISSMMPRLIYDAAALTRHYRNDD